MSSRLRIHLWQLLLALTYIAIVLACSRTRLSDCRFSRWDWSIDLAAVALTPINLAGLVWAAMRLVRQKRMSAGEILWAWLGVAWGSLLIAEHQHGWVGQLEHLAGLCFVSAIASVGAGFGPRPPKFVVAWAHMVGWALIEIDVVFWGMMACGEV
jgi:hypothetical protein